MRSFIERFTVALGVLATFACSPLSRDEAGGLRVERVGGRTVYSNHLVDERSPYLQQHAHNPVNWYPWGTEAFERAKREDKPVFLSIGYSTCHWCHVMEAESFSDPAIAGLINGSFVAVKVDREERPDVERVYMTYLTSVSNGGWPMTLILTPALEPFFGATYLPPSTRNDLEGVREVVTRLGARWRTDRAPLLEAAASGASIVNESAQIPRAAAEADAAAALDETFHSLARGYDAVNGGFGGVNKFPRPVALTFLMRYHARTKTAAARTMVLATLHAMANGAIHDQLGGGFHRYTLDAAWRVPHFEKMLSDQAQLIAAYAEAYQLTKDDAIASVVRSTAAYVLRELRGAEGAFYSAEDADSAAGATDDRLREGAFYVWTREALDRVLGDDAPVAAFYYDVGSAPVPFPGSEAEGLALAVRHTLAETAVRFRMTEAEARRVLASVRQRLSEARARRPRPARDDKIVTAWNGLTISALARAGQMLDAAEYVDAARHAAVFIESHMLDASTLTLKRRFSQGVAGIDGLLEDYAFMVQGLLDLYEASHEPRWLRLAAQLQGTQDRLFWDGKDGAYFSTREDASHLLARMKEDYDGAEPSANSVSALNLLRLWQLLEDDAWRARADATFRAMSGRVARSGSAVPQLMAALDFRRSRPKQIVIAGAPDATDTRDLLRLVHSRYIPNKVLSVVDGGRQQAELATLVPQLAAMNRRDHRATLYVCENYACRLPTADLTVAARLLDEP